MRTLATVQERILDRALFLIGTHGDDRVSVREITQAAGVNVNAINYYFGTKEKLLKNVQAFFIANYKAAYAVLDGEGDARQRLESWANEVMEYTLRYPGIQRLQKWAFQNDHPSALQQFLTENAEAYDQKLMSVLRIVFPTDEKTLALVRIMFYGAILHPACFGTEINYDTSRITDKEFRLSYIRAVISIIQQGVLHHEV